MLCGTGLAGCGESDHLVTNAAPPTPEARSERVWVDATRPTARNGNYPGAPDRTVRTLIWQPATAGPLPLLVMAHGFSGLPEQFEGMGPAIADGGFVVAALAFPLTNYNAPGGYSHALQDVANQPADVSFVISKLLEANAAPGDPLYGRIAAGEIAVLGTSLGGATTIALTRKDCCRDTRVRAAILVAAAPLDLFPTLFGTDSIVDGPPTLLLNGTLDEAVNYATSQAMYALFDPPKVLVLITGADHNNAIEAKSLPLTSLQLVTKRSVVAFLNAMFRGASADLQTTLDTLAAEGNPTQSEGTLP